MPEAFYLPADGRFESTTATRGPWARDLQHGGPPSALVAHVLERNHARDDARIARITLEILRPVPIAPLEVTTTVLRPGRKVELLGASLTAAGVECLRAQAWRIRTQPVDLPAGAGRHGSAPPPLPAAGPVPFFPTGEDEGYHTAMDVRFVEGGFLELGPASVWMRTRVPVVAGEPVRPLSRILCAADSGNGVSGELDFRRWIFINPDLTVYVQREPAGEWVHLAARTTLDASGTGLAESTISDDSGPLARGLQALYLEDRQA